MFGVRATDAAGNTGTAATHQWTFTPPFPDLVITRLTGTSMTVTNIGGAVAGPFVARVIQVATYTFSGLQPGQSATRTWSVCRQGTISAVADAGQAVAESDERNNSASITNVC